MYNQTLCLEDINFPVYEKERAYLEDEEEPLYIDDLAASLEADLRVISSVVALENVDTGSPFIDNFNRYRLMEESGLEANKFVEAAKQNFYKLKTRATQFVKYIFGFILNFLRGSSDVKAVIQKYYNKLKSYKKQFEKMRPPVTKSDDESIKMRDVRGRILTSIGLILTLTEGLDLLLNRMYKDSDGSGIGPETKILRFAFGINCINNSLSTVSDFTENVEKETDDENGSISFTSTISKIGNVLKRIFTEVKYDPEKAVTFKIPDDNSKTVKSTLNSMKEIYKDKVESSEISYENAYRYMKKTFSILESLIDPKNHNWNFKKLSQKVDKISRDLTKEIDKLSSNNDSEGEVKHMNKSTTNAISIVTNAGTYMSITKEIVVVSLKTFKSDMDIFFTEALHVGSLCYKKQ